MTDDPVVRQVREVRQQISAEFHHEVAEYLAHLRSLDEQNSERLWQGQSNIDTRLKEKVV